jgi:hypothetical protein
VPPVNNNITGGFGHRLMLVVGVIEIFAGGKFYERARSSNSIAV